jgi:hypothetical protein
MTRYTFSFDLEIPSEERKNVEEVLERALPGVATYGNGEVVKKLSSKKVETRKKTKE